MSLRYMQFNVPVVFDFLQKHRHVLTVRGYDYHTEFAKVADLDATIQRVKVCEVKTIEDLNGFVALSGFKTTREWWKQINIFCKGRKWLYRCVIIDEEGLSTQEQEQDRKEYQREFEQANAWSNEDEIGEILSHPLDIRSEPSMKDPSLVDLTAAKAQAHHDRIDADERAADRKRERLREIYGEQMQAAPTQETHDPERIMRVSSAEQALKALCGNSYAA